ncbi:MAG: type II toxin-antitoxin system HicA family toxin [Patescibacteria group bacterium]|nr:type II toxin-antitoxin system HicA family toxin [Patescibacteria group bacterium]
MPKIQSVHWKEFEKFLLRSGCMFKREKGDHRVYWKEGITRPIIVPRDTALPAFIILNNLRILGISRDEYLKAIGKR